MYKYKKKNENQDKNWNGMPLLQIIPKLYLIHITSSVEVIRLCFINIVLWNLQSQDFLYS